MQMHARLAVYCAVVQIPRRRPSRELRRKKAASQMEETHSRLVHFAVRNLRAGIIIHRHETRRRSRRARRRIDTMCIRRASTTKGPATPRLPTTATCNDRIKWCAPRMVTEDRRRRSRERRNRRDYAIFIDDSRLSRGLASDGNTVTGYSSS